MDWVQELQEKFSNDNEINNLKEEKFWGYIQINFFNGKIGEINKYQTIKPIIK